MTNGNDGRTLKDYCRRIVEWRGHKGFTTSWDNFAEKCMLLVTEVSEAVEADRTFDRDHVPEELADVFIRLADLCGSLGIDLEDAVEKKLTVIAARPPKHGKRY